MNKIILLSLIIGLITVACSDPNTIGLEVHPTSDNIIINSSNFENFNSKTESEDSLRTDEALNLILGEISDLEFGANSGSFYTQILLAENNTDLGTNPVVDSVVLSYTYSGYYGNLEEFTNLEVNQIFEDLSKDSLYYSNSFGIGIGNIYNVETFNLSGSIDDPFLRVKLIDSFGQYILDLGAQGKLVDNETFLQEFKGISVLANAENTILYLNPDGSNSFLKIYYHNNESGSDTLSLDFELGGDAARINLFNEKNENSITEDNSRLYIQSMAGYKMKISINNIDSIKSLLEGRPINKATMCFEVENGSQSTYEAHDKLVLVRVNDEGNNVFLLDIDQGDSYFGGGLENDKYEFNITQYLTNLLNDNSYTKDLYLLPAGSAVNANRTILNKDIKLEIYYSEL